MSSPYYSPLTYVPATNMSFILSLVINHFLHHCLHSSFDPLLHPSPPLFHANRRSENVSDEEGEYSSIDVVSSQKIWVVRSIHTCKLKAMQAMMKILWMIWMIGKDLICQPVPGESFSSHITETRFAFVLKFSQLPLWTLARE